MKNNDLKIHFVGAGPGAPDLITLRGAQHLNTADTVLYTGSLIHPDLLQHCPQAICYNTASMDLNEVVERMIGDYQAGKKVVRLHTGDTTLYSTINEQIEFLKQANISYEITPGVSSVFAATAALGVELTQPGITQSLLITRRAGRTPVPKKEEIRSLAPNDTSLALFLSAADIAGLVDDLLCSGRDLQTPIAIVYRASWPDQQIIQGTLGNIVKKAQALGLKRQAMILVGKALAQSGSKSLLYHPSFQHGYRQKYPYWLHRPLAIYALTQSALRKAQELQSGLFGAHIFCRSSLVDSSNATEFKNNSLADTITQNWNHFEGHFFIMATGIAIRHCAPLLKNKTTDPAVVSCDEKGNHSIALLGGHLGGANQLAKEAASIFQGKAIISTATDTHGIIAADEWARLFDWEIQNPKLIRKINNALLQGQKIYCRGLEASHQIFAIPQYQWKESKTNGTIEFAISAHFTESLQCIPRFCSAGIGCRQGTSQEEIMNALTSTLRQTGRNFSHLKKIASATLKEKETGLLQLADELKTTLEFYTKEQLETPRGLAPSLSKTKVGIHCVSESAALLSGKGSLLLEKQIYGNTTIALGRI